MPLEAAKAEQALRALGVTPTDIHGVRTAPTFENAIERLEALKERVRKSFKRLALELHPDLTGGDEGKTALFRDVVAMKAEIESLQVSRPAPPPPRMPMMVVVYQEAFQGTPAPFSGVGRPPPGHPAAGGGLRQQPLRPNAVTVTVTMGPNGVPIIRGT